MNNNENWFNNNDDLNKNNNDNDKIQYRSMNQGNKRNDQNQYRSMNQGNDQNQYRSMSQGNDQNQYRSMNQGNDQNQYRSMSQGNDQNQYRSMSQETDQDQYRSMNQRNDQNQYRNMNHDIDQNQFNNNQNEDSIIWDTAKFDDIDNRNMTGGKFAPIHDKRYQHYLTDDNFDPNFQNNNNNPYLNQPNKKNSKNNEPKKNSIKILGLNIPKVLLKIVGISFGVFFFFFVFGFWFTSNDIFALDASNTSVIDKVKEQPKDKKIEIVIKKATTIDSIADELKKKDLIGSTILFKLLATYNRAKDENLRRGTHVLSKGLTYGEVLVKLTSDPEESYLKTVVIPEGYNQIQIAELMEKAGLMKKDEFHKIANMATFKSQYSFLKNRKENKDWKFSLEGYLFPDTYQFDPEGNKEDYVKKMLGRFDSKIPNDIEERAKKLNKTVDEIITMASIVEKEGGKNDEWENISSVFYNRILKGTGGKLKVLESDAILTYIIFAKTGIIKPSSEITDNDKKIQDPYNCFMYEKLPPGPICNPGIRAIEAALNPATTNYFYFVAKGDKSGMSVFSKTNLEHDRNVLIEKKNAEKNKTTDTKNTTKKQ